MESEIVERRAFLREMERLGRGGDYRTVIETEISKVNSQPLIMSSLLPSVQQWFFILPYGRLIIAFKFACWSLFRENDSSFVNSIRGGW